MEARCGHELIDIFGITAHALTANEARYLVGFRKANKIRNRLAKTKQEIDLRLRSKGIPSVFGAWAGVAEAANHLTVMPSQV
ncbi:MAG: hypothetical protein A2503_09300 [Burkholderiales bacterium RIFOXYD12_FULL_59_19]|nr:MAG: hypothetical protein A2503_09300 [Burkholderiales bacterium RIFOXYD12_FULL_59_19]